MKDLSTIISEAEKIQKEMHSYIDSVFKDARAANISYDSFKDVYFMMKIAELQEEIKSLKQYIK